MSDAAGRSDYITPAGWRRLEAELERLWSTERPKVTREVAAAAAEGDRSENAAYIYGKKRLREIDARIRELTKKLDRLQIVQPTARDDGRIFFGAWVTLGDEQGEEVRYRLVGPDETRAEEGLISIDSPMGRALVGREEGDEVVVRRPAGQKTFEVLAVDYEEAG
jgi:transcription elongation factor GreB